MVPIPIGLLRTALKLKNASRMVLNGMEDPFDPHFFLFAQQVDFVEGKRGHGHDVRGG